LDESFFLAAPALILLRPNLSPHLAKNEEIPRSLLHFIMKSDKNQSAFCEKAPLCIGPRKSKKPRENRLLITAHLIETAANISLTIISKKQTQKVPKRILENITPKR